MHTAWRLIRLWLLVVALAAPAPSIAAQGVEAEPLPRALLIGVDQYVRLTVDRRLEAPAQDVRRLHAALVEAGYPAARIQTMTEDGPTSPTREAVIRALSDLAREARPGQEVMIYFSGHGLQAPARHPDREPDGLEELYLMADAAADPAAGTMSGALADFELEAAIAAIRAKGADVVLIADACHAAGVTRSGAVDGRIKGLSPDELGLPPAERLRSGAVETVPVNGDFIGLYAAAPGEVAIERRLPLGGRDATVASTFTWTLTQAVRDGRHRSWRDLQQGVRDVAVEAGPGSVPVFEGRLDRAPAGFDRDRPRWFRTYWSGGDLMVAAGALQALSAGEALELVDIDGSVLGGAVVREAGALTSRIETASIGAFRARRVASSGPTPFLERLSPVLQANRASQPLQVAGYVWPGGCQDSPPMDPWSHPAIRRVSLEASPELAHCEILYVRLSNAGGAPLDVAAFFVNAAGASLPLTLAPDNSPRLEPGQDRHVAVRILTRDESGAPLPAGAETILFAWSPASGRTPRDLRSLADPTPARGVDTGAVHAIAFALRTDLDGPR